MPENPLAEQVLSAVLEASEDAVLEVCLSGKVKRWSRAAERLYGYSEDEIVGQSLTQIVPLYEMPALEALLHDAGRGELRRCDTTERIRKDGTRIIVAARRIAIRDERGEIAGILESAHGLQPSVSATPAEKQLRLLVEQMPVMLWTTDQRMRITSNWGSGLALSRLRPGELVGKPVSDLLDCREPGAVAILRHFDALNGLASRFEYKRGERVLEIQLEPLRSAEGEIAGCIGAALDVTERKKTEEEIRFQATHDGLTGLANYREFMETLEREVKRADRSHHSFALMLLDLDGLKQINDRQGHLAGNRAIRRLADVMREHCRSTDLAARYGGDEFALVMIDSDPGMARQVAERIATCLKNEKEEPPLSVSIGVASYPSDGRTAQELVESADKQLYQQKKFAKFRAMSAL